MSQTDANSHTDNETAIKAVVILAISSSSVIMFTILFRKLSAFIRDKYRRKWVLQRLLPSLQQTSYKEAIELIAGRFEATECSLCLGLFEDDEETVTVLPSCNHIYRPGCIKDWLLKSTLLPTFPCCPMCKSTIVISSSS